LIPRHGHDRSKAQTTLLESGNRLLRHYLARFHRNNKGYSKRKCMLRQAGLLVRAQKNDTFPMLM
jgi:IS1 family transposase